MTVSSDENLRERAEAACRAACGRDWDSMYSGDQEAQIDAWIDGYNAGATAEREACAALCEDDENGFPTEGKLCAAEIRERSNAIELTGRGSEAPEGPR